MYKKSSSLSAVQTFREYCLVTGSTSITNTRRRRYVNTEPTDGRRATRRHTQTHNTGTTADSALSWHPTTLTSDRHRAPLHVSFLHRHKHATATSNPSLHTSRENLVLNSVSKWTELHTVHTFLKPATPSFSPLLYLLYNRTHTYVCPISLLLLHPFNDLFSRTTSARKVNHSGFYWSKRRWSGSAISWTICKSFAPHSRQITTPVPHHSVFTGGTPFLPPNQQHQSTEGRCLSYISAAKNNMDI